MGPDVIHETIIKDITDIIKDGINITRDISGSSKGAGYASSITKATKGLVMEFPVLISKANHIESAGIVAKAYEAKFVTLLHMAFAASNISNSTEGLEFLKNFHTNLDAGKLSVDEFIDIMDAFVEENGTITAEDYAKYKAVTEDMKNLCFCFGEDISEAGLNDYKVMNNYGRIKVVKELMNTSLTQTMDEKIKAAVASAETNSKASTSHGKKKSEKKSKADDAVNGIVDSNKGVGAAISQHSDDKKAGEDDDKEFALKQQRLELDKSKHALDIANSSHTQLTNYIVSSDLKKANELVPTMMVVNFSYLPDDSIVPQAKQMVVGVKAKLYEVEPMDVINKLITKHIDNNLLLKLVQVNTRQISFVKDFLLAIDNAKLDALSRSKRGSTNKLFKVLERRSVGSRASRALRMKDYCKAITSLVISQEEAEELLKNNIDVSNPKVIRPIMEKLNLISFAIIDESAEAVKFIWDTGDDIYETIPLSRLEKEQKDGMSKKVINLMAKMNR